MIAEIYYPEYTKIPAPYVLHHCTYREGQQCTTSRYYSHTLLVVDLAGNMVWNNSINLKNVSTRQLNDITQLTK
jgi:hypothetical protein